VIYLIIFIGNCFKYFIRSKNIIGVVCLLVFTQLQAGEDNPIAERYISHAIQGDLRPAHALLMDLSPHSAAAGDLQLAAQFRDRFIDKSDSTSPDSGNLLVDGTVTAYRDYWLRALMVERSRQENVDQLNSSLEILLIKYGDIEYLENSSNVHEQLGQLLATQGYNALLSPAPPIQDLLLWEKQEQRSYSVSLTDRTQRVDVVFMDGFHSLGWKHYATLGLASTTGWVENSKLYCVEWAYETDSENFAVSYLKHEARHLADFEQFPALPAADLEYRAKLTELAFAVTTLRRILEDFTHKSAENPESPHALANYRVTRDLYHELYGVALPENGTNWLSLNAGKVNRAARELLARNTERLLASD